jgi:hypothetical protein
VAVIVEVPMATPVATPAGLIVAVAGVPEDQATTEVRFWVEPSE